MTSGGLTNIAAHLPEMARRQPDTPAIYIPTGRGQQYRQYSFKQLDQECDRIANALESIGISRGIRTALMVTPSLEFFALTFALFKVGAVPIMIDPGIGVKNLKVCLSEAQPEAFIGIPKAHVARLLFGWGKPTLKILLTVGSKLFWGGFSLSSLKRKFPAGKSFSVVDTDAADTAAILFTSGSTGVPKGVVYTHGNFIAQVEQLRQVYNIRPGEIDLPTFPLFALFAPALGMSSVLPLMDFTRPGSVDPKNIIGPILKFNITTMFGSPALINRVGRYGQENGVKLPTLKRVISAGAPVPASVLKRFTKMLNDDVQVFTPYGATESLPVCSIGSYEILSETASATDRGMGVCIGRPVANINLEIIGISDEPIDWWDDSLKLPAGEIGEIAVSGPQVTRRYFNRKESTNLAKILDPVNATFYHRMGDLGYRDEQGRIWFCGRKAHRVTCQEQTLFTIPCEAIFNTHGKVFRSALVGVGAPGRMEPAICIELEQDVSKEEHARILQELKLIGKKHELTRSIKHILFHPAFPVDIRHNAKIFREKLAVWAKGKLR
ncbi:fatty acid CoA ligase family protein [Malonomonas rubra]|uniref:fatty acid CoA ligase family protein n=1 Tax=Malonomonas rubra TaxID=57040 RepID=UPI0026F18D89|nr:fatty acid CoA ligase family protein [Malonomonas rubra]